jgi:hypothetical protein
MEEAIKYFQQYNEYFWQWETDSDTVDYNGDEYNMISIPHVSVIAYRTHALEVLKTLADDGIPPFGAFLLVLYATGNFKFSNFDGLNYYLTRIEKKYGLPIDKKAVLSFLTTIVSLPAKLKTGEKKVLLFQTIFHDCHHQLAAAKADRVLKAIRSSDVLIACATSKAFNEAAYNRDLGLLQKLNDKFPDVTSIMQAMGGLPQLPKLDEEIAEQEPVATEKNFVDRLIEEPKTFEVGKLIRHIWGGLKIPMQHFSPGDQPIGGISDMTNKGNIDRMLLSEFAYDDTTFLQRVANNEALYIQREIPPEKNIFERVIIIDVSLRNWGTPKVLALATALAIARHPKAKDECRILLAEKKITEVKYEKVEDVIAALSIVGPTPDCSAGLQTFFASEPLGKKREVFLLTTDDSFKLPAVQKAISDYREQVKFVICFSASGLVQAYKMHQGAKRLLQTIVLPLEDLWQKPPVKRATLTKDRLYPILFTASASLLGGFYIDKVFYFLSRKRILYKTYQPDNQPHSVNYFGHLRGWEPVVKNISLKPRGAFALGKNEESNLLLCQYNSNEKMLSILNLQTKSYASVQFNAGEQSKLVFFENNFYVFHEETNDCQKITISEDTLVLFRSRREKQLHLEFDRQQAEVERARDHYTKDIMTNHHSVAITEDGCLHFSKHTLIRQHEKLMLVNRRQSSFKLVATRQGNTFCFIDGSKVIIDNDGMITLCSSDKALPEIFIPSCVGTWIAAATTESFCGEEYYLPQNHHFSIESVESFYKTYIAAFIQQIITHAPTA